MDVATSRLEVGVRELKNNLSRYLGLVSEGSTVIVTDRGRPIARLTSLDDEGQRLAELIASGLVSPPAGREKRRPRSRIEAGGSVSDLVESQRR